MKIFQKRPFSIGLYAEGLRQLRIIGILGALLLFGSSLVININEALYVQRQADSSNYLLSARYGLEAAPFLLTVFCFFAPLMTLYLFHFMNKRNSSDFLFAIPHTRLSLYCSYLGAIITWNFILVFSGIIGVLIPGAIFHNDLSIAYNTVFAFALSTFVYSLQVTTAVLLAMSITGTIFSNLILSAVILFAPRLLLYMLLAVRNNLPFVYHDANQVSFLSDFINPIFGIVFGSVMGISDSSTSTIFYYIAPFSPFCYSLILSILYFIAAAFFFQKRKSETAGKSAPSPKLQAVYRITITMIYCIVLAVVLLSEVWEWDREMVFEAIIAYLVAVVIYFLFELFMTRNLKKMWHAAPGLLIVLVLNGVMIFGIHTIIEQACQFQPTAEEVTSISFVQTEGGQNDYISFQDYVLSHCDSTITDDSLKESILENLKKDVELVESGGRESYYNDARSSYDTYNFRIVTTSGTKNRSIRLDPKTQRALAAWLKEALQDSSNGSWRELPEAAPNLDAYTYSDISACGINSSDTNTLLESLRQELQTIDFSDWYAVNNSNEEVIFTFDYYVQNSRMETYQLEIPVYASLYPKTVQRYYTMLYDSQKTDLEEFQNFLNDQMPSMQENSDYDLQMTVHYYDTESQTTQAYATISANLIQTVLEKGLLNHPISLTDSYVDLEINVYYDEYTQTEDAYYGGYLRVAVDSAILKQYLSEMNPVESEITEEVTETVID